MDPKQEHAATVVTFPITLLQHHKTLIYFTTSCVPLAPSLSLPPASLLVLAKKSCSHDPGSESRPAQTRPTRPRPPFLLPHDESCQHRLKPFRHLISDCLARSRHHSSVERVLRFKKSPRSWWCSQSSPGQVLPPEMALCLNDRRLPWKMRM